MSPGSSTGSEPPLFSPRCYQGIKTTAALPTPPPTPPPQSLEDKASEAEALRVKAMIHEKLAQRRAEQPLRMHSVRGEVYNKLSRRIAEREIESALKDAMMRKVSIRAQAQSGGFVGAAPGVTLHGSNVAID